MTTYPVSLSFYDYYTDSASTVTGTSTLFARYANSFFPSLESVAFGVIDTSAIPDDDVISAATFSFNAPTYTATKGVTKNFFVQYWNGSIYTNFTNGLDVVWSAGVNSFSLTPSELSFINKTGFTLVRIAVTDPGVGKDRIMTIYAYENNPSTAMRFDVTHGAPGSGVVPQRTLLGVGV